MPEKTSNAKHVRAYRERMRRAGLRLIQLWVPDSRARGFAAECRRQSLVAAGNEPLEHELGAWIDATRDTENWTG